MTITIPDLCLVALIGSTGSGKSTFGRTHFRPTEVLSSDFFRGLISDDENDQAATNDAFETLYFVAGKRLAARKLTVIDATNVQPESRAPIVALARRFHCLPVAVVLNLPESVCHERNAGRADRAFGPHVVRNHVRQLRRSLGQLRNEGFRYVIVLNRPDEVDSARVERVPLWTDRRGEAGPFDIIGDVHGCATELESLLETLGYDRVPLEGAGPGWGDWTFAHPSGRKAVFVGDLVDRGPRSLDVVRIARGMVATGRALCVPGNHDVKLLKKLQGKKVRVAHGLAQTLAEIDALSDDVRAPFCKELAGFLDGLISHFVLDGGRLVVAHAGMKAEMQGRSSSAVRDFALYGETTGETDDLGLPVRLDWAADYRGNAAVVYGHTPVPDPNWFNNTVNIDTGCVFGGKLTALRYPEREFVSVPAGATYCEPSRPFLAPPQGLTEQQKQDDLLDAADVLGKRVIQTRLMANVTVRAENAAAALEVMSRFAVDPRWLIYLPPTMSPTEASREPGLLEHPAQAFDYFRSEGVPAVVCEEKHMGSRAVVVVCRDEEAARRRFGVTSGELGVAYTRTGRRFFNDPELEAAFLGRLRAALVASGFWEARDTTWACLDAEVLPWSAKAQGLIRDQYAAVGAAGLVALPAAEAALAKALGRLEGEARAEALPVFEAIRERRDDVERYVRAYRGYCWPVGSVDDLKVAPFHLLATDQGAHVDRNHLWHMESLAPVAAADPLFVKATPYRVVDLTDPSAVEAATRWWADLTEAGGEGMVVKPVDFIARGPRGLAQPAVKCRGREYLRIIYGPDYTMPANLTRLRGRSVAHKRSLALREFALGVEALERFARGEPLRRSHECVFGVLALESEPVDPRL